MNVEGTNLTMFTKQLAVYHQTRRRGSRSCARSLGRGLCFLHLDRYASRTVPEILKAQLSSEV